MAEYRIKARITSEVELVVEADSSAEVPEIVRQLNLREANGMVDIDNYTTVTPRGNAVLEKANIYVTLSNIKYKMVEEDKELYPDGVIVFPKTVMVQEEYNKFKDKYSYDKFIANCLDNAIQDDLSYKFKLCEPDNFTYTIDKIEIE